jgi:stage II sporulation protein M
MTQKKKKTEKTSFNLIKEYKKSWEYIKESKKFIYIIIGIFFFFALVAFFIPVPKIVEEKIMSFIQELLVQIKDMPLSDLVKFIISNNVKSTFFSIFLGIILGIFPLVGTIANGYILGFVSLLSINEDGILSLWRIFPHGIFELPAMFISLGLGLKLGTFIFQKKKLLSLKTYLINSLRVFLLVILPLLVLAGIIEGTLMTLA